MGNRSGAIYTVAMSQEDGCIVMIENGRHVVGSLTREQTIGFAQGCLEWKPVEPGPPLEVVKAVHKVVRKSAGNVIDLRPSNQAETLPDG
jgi:hypothetical protein